MLVFFPEKKVSNGNMDDLLKNEKHWIFLQIQFQINLKEKQKNINGSAWQKQQIIKDKMWPFPWKKMQKIRNYLVKFVAERLDGFIMC